MSNENGIARAGRKIPRTNHYWIGLDWIDSSLAWPEIVISFLVDLVAAWGYNMWSGSVDGISFGSERRLTQHRICSFLRIDSVASLGRTPMSHRNATQPTLRLYLARRKMDCKHSPPIQPTHQFIPFRFA
jgi:hypothetical protein